jgi:hypothetical protein
MPHLIAVFSVYRHTKGLDDLRYKRSQTKMCKVGSDIQNEKCQNIARCQNI